MAIQAIAKLFSFLKILRIAQYIHPSLSPPLKAKMLGVTIPNVYFILTDLFQLSLLKASFLEVVPLFSQISKRGASQV